MSPDIKGFNKIFFYFRQAVIDELVSKGHNVSVSTGLAVVNAISMENNRIFAYADRRKSGGVAGF